MFDADKLKKALENEEFAEAYNKLETIKDAVVSLNENGIDVSEEEFAAVVKVIKAYQSSDGELDDATLENVAGGIIPGSSFHKWCNDTTLIPRPLFITVSPADPVLLVQ